VKIVTTVKVDEPEVRVAASQKRVRSPIGADDIAHLDPAAQTYLESVLATGRQVNSARSAAHSRGLWASVVPKGSDCQLRMV
jgi:hypothetical protein